MTRKRVIIIVSLLIAVLALGVGTASAATLREQRPKPAAATPAGHQAFCQAVQDQFAKDLGISVDQLNSTRKGAVLKVIDQQVAAGKITADQAQKLRDRVNAAQPCQHADRHPQAHHAIKEITKVEVAAVAKKLNLSEADLIKELHSGESLLQIAQAQNPPVSADALKATMRDALKGQLDQALQAGKITQQQHDQALAAFDARIDQIINRQFGHKK